jgi:hypothetical protein
MHAFSIRFVSFALVAAVALGAREGRAQAPTTYTLGGVSCAAAPLNFDFYCFDGGGLVGYRAALASAANFGPGGAVPVSVTTVAVSSFTPGDLSDIDGLLIPWWAAPDAAPHVNAVKDYFLAGGDLFILADNPGNDPVNAALGVPTLFPGVPPGATSGTAPLYAGPFGAAASVTQFFAVGQLDPATVTLLGGRVVGTNAGERPVAAVWDRNAYAPGAGRLVIVTDVDMLVESFGAAAVYEPLAARNDNGRFGLNATAFLVAGGAIDGLTYDLIGVPSCAISPGGFGAYCGLSSVLFPLVQAASSGANFGPAGTVQRRVAFTEFTALPPSLSARLRAVIVPWIADADAASYAEALRAYFLGGGNLWLFQDDREHDPIGALLGVPTPTLTGGNTRTTNGTAPVYDGPFGLATNVLQFFVYGGLLESDVIGHGGTIVGTADDNGEHVAAAWDRGQYAPGAGRMVVVTDVDSIYLFGAPPANTSWALNTLAYLVTGGQFDTDPPVLTCTATPDTLWAPSGKPVPVTVAGTATDAGGGLDATSLAFSVVDEYGTVQPSGAVAVGSGGAYSVAVPLVAKRNGKDKDGRTYTVTVTARDLAGNATSCSVQVRVPHDQRR